MSLVGVLDNTATRAATLTGMKAAHSCAATTMPRSIDDWPVAIVWPDGGDMQAGNAESLLHHLELRIWVNATDAAFALSTLMPFVERCQVLFRTDLDIGGEAVRLLMTGYGAPEVETAHGKPFFVLPVGLEAFELRLAHDYAV